MPTLQSCDLHHIVGGIVSAVWWHTAVESHGSSAPQHIHTIQNSLLTITPVFEAPWYDEKPRWPWPIASVPPFSFVPMVCDPTDDILGSFFAGFARESDPPDERPAPVQLGDIIEDGALSRDGGLKFTAGVVTIHPGCCADLGMTTELIEFIKTGAKPWTGHDPAPWAIMDRHEITIWSDGGLEDRQVEPWIKTTKSVFRDQLRSACATLTSFGQCCQKWLIDHEIPQADEIHERIARDFEFRDPSTDSVHRTDGP